MSVFHYDKDADGIVTVTMDMTGPVNAMNTEYRQAMDETVAKLQAESGLTGVVLASAKKVFFAGGDLKELLSAQAGDEAKFMEELGATKAGLRALEKLPVPVVSAINGAALGGGFEICLSTNYRIAYNHKSVQLGLPEVGLGLLPGGGGIVRMVNLLGLQNALPYLLEGKKVTPEKALKAGMIHETVESLEELVPRAKAWILENKDNEAAAVQPWDQKGHKIPGGGASSPKLAQVLMAAPAMLSKTTRGLLPAPEKIMDCAVEAARLDFDTALRVESRGLAYLVTTPEAKNMITTFFFQMNKINGGASRPKDVPPQETKKLGVLGAGMMGQGIAYSSAMAGIEVILKDISVEAAEKGKAYSEKLLDKAISRGRMTEEKKAQVLALIKPTANDEDLQGCDLIIEAVFENIELKNKITASTEKYLSEDGIWGSNTSTLPITQLAEGSSKPDNFIGIHFFSPVDKMPLVEIICGEKTSDIALAKAYDYTKQIRKTPIVVNDSLGFFTSRTFGTYFDEGVRVVTEGVHPVKVDNIGKAIGMPVGPLTVHDETSLELSRKAMETWADMGVKNKYGEQNALEEMIAFMIGEHGRGGRHHGGGYFEYGADGSKTIWPGLVDKFYKPEVEMSDQDIKDRLLFRQVIEALKCLETGVLRTVADGNIGSIMGIGAPIWTGGFLQFVNTYGLEKFQARCTELAAAYGERFTCPAIVGEKIAAGDTFQ
ncbi:Fatty acid oxidation complex subunit alpha [Zhongshania aliphaticivorans]|uniref:Fatty acid oxidation complex subunit alpha n=1 Tax=Zhongshania aliphaticivorans TaxID=1470434 RepID=A0A5S9MZH9_9GAMM|nr:3-hydroxyacyl-CoA dehydrogenase NAD-binding domain-containing protein [Zhongshania aliphaticivorans]CAA0081694.1 Fatty acid oxidation complex subunit alpha [Zhongshania aliphaticivorans]CAA0084717.1 Fatty acid oxidation complex subunit alpha [Zhongshania aliphaticivorans]